MKNSIPHAFLIFFLILVCLSWTVSLWAQYEFRGRLMPSGAGYGSAVNIRVKIDSLSTPDEVRQLAQAYNSGGEAAFFAAFRKINKGSLRFTGALGLNIAINAAFENATETEHKFVLFGKSQSVEPGGSRQTFGGFLFLAIELNLDKDFKGEGKIHEAAKIQFTPQGGIVIDSYTSPPKEIVDVRPIK
jgi:hypothetical protein